MRVANEWNRMTSVHYFHGRVKNQAGHMYCPVNGLWYSAMELTALGVHLKGQRNINIYINQLEV